MPLPRVLPGPAHGGRGTPRPADGTLPVSSLCPPPPPKSPSARTQSRCYRTHTDGLILTRLRASTQVSDEVTPRREGLGPQHCHTKTEAEVESGCGGYLPTRCPGAQRGEGNGEGYKHSPAPAHRALMNPADTPRGPQRESGLRRGHAAGAGRQSLAHKDRPWARYRPPPIFVNKVLLEPSYDAHSFGVDSGCFRSTAAGCAGAHAAHKTGTIYCPSRHRTGAGCCAGQ